MSAPLEIFAVAAPGLAPALAAEIRDAGFEDVSVDPAGVTFRGGWPEVWRANLCLRGATRILVRLAAFRAMHLAQLDKRARKLPWADWLRPDVPVRVEATCRKSKIYHAGAATKRIEGALTAFGATIAPDAGVAIKARIDDDLCTISIDTSGSSLHQRGLKQEVNKAPMRETLAALFLRESGFSGREPVCDPMCGSGTFPIEAAEIASGLLPGRSRRFAFEDLAGFDPAVFAAMRRPAPPRDVLARFHGSDRDQGAIRMSLANAERAGVAELARFDTRPVSEAVPPEGPPGLVIVNPPYGGRIGNRKLLFGLYAAFGQRMKAAFPGWRVGLITADAGLAKATGLPFGLPGPVVDHGGTRIRLWQAGPI
jgi:putative N6-adenine-specific DNA methylase